jgi:hypothetical protein
MTTKAPNVPASVMTERNGPRALKETLHAADYSTGHPQHGGRCGTCRHCKPMSKYVRQTTYDRVCELHHAAVKTHGKCSLYEVANPTSTAP